MLKPLELLAVPQDKGMANWGLPHQADRAIADQVAEYISMAAKLDFVDSGEFARGRVAWKERLPVGEKVQEISAAA